MASHHSWIVRSLMVLAAAAGLFLGAVAGIPAAWAHVHVSADSATRGASTIVTFQVPNESNTGAATTSFTVTLPDVASARAETMPGWTVKLDRDAPSGTVRSVTWTAAPNGGIGADQFALFRLAVQLPDTDSVSFPATQTYSDGAIVKWDQPPLPGGGEPEHPAPALQLGAPSTAPPDHHAAGHPQSAEPSAGAGGGPAAGPSKGPDNAARLLAGAALVVAAVGVCLALIRRRA